MNIKQVKTILCVVVLAGICETTLADTHYVSLDGTSVAPYTNWVTAATNIQDAVDEADSALGGRVVVSNGTYTLTQEITVLSDATIEGLNGPDSVIIDGGGVARCFYLDAGGMLSGLTMTNGVGAGAVGGGGAIRGRDYSVVTNCIFLGNSTPNFGGAIREATVYNCIFRDNHARRGGAVDDATIYNCLFESNSSDQEGGAASRSVVYSSTFVGNHADATGGGVGYNSVAYFSIFLDNTALTMGPDFDSTSAIYTSCSAFGDAFGAESYNITNAPAFINGAAGDYRLRYGSPCIDPTFYADPPAVMNDLLGAARVINGAADWGAYEYDVTTYNSDADELLDAVEIQAGLNPLISNVGMDIDGDGLLDLDEVLIYGTSPTNDSVFQLVAAAGTNGTVYPSGTNDVIVGRTTNFVIAANDYYLVDDIQTNGISIGAVTNFVWMNVVADGVLSATFKMELATNNVPIEWLAAFGYTNDFDVAALADLDADGLPNWREYELGTSPTNDSVFELVATAGTNGIIYPAGTNLVIMGQATNFTITADTYYSIYDVQTNGVSVGAVTNIAWTNIIADGTIHAEFAADLATNNVPHWWLASYGFTNDFDAAALGDQDNDTLPTWREFQRETSPLVPDRFSIEVTAGEYGMVAPAGTIWLDAGATTTLVFSADAYYSIKDVWTNGMSVGPISELVWSPAEANGTVHVEFTPTLTSNGVPHLWLVAYGITNDFESAMPLTMSDLDSARAMGVADVTSDPNAFGLYTSNAVLDLAIGDVGVEIVGTNAELRVQLWQSDDLNVWTNASDAVQWKLPVDAEKKFFRIRAEP